MKSTQLWYGTLTLMMTAMTAWSVAAQDKPPAKHWNASTGEASSEPGLIKPVALRWNAEQLGNHRYTVQVDTPADAVRVTIPWRRRDHNPQDVAIIVMDPDGRTVSDVARLHIDQTSGELVFRAKQAGIYAVYYQPYITSGSANYPTVVYRKPENTADPTWLQRHGLADAKRVQALPQARVIGYEAVDDFDAYTDMERIASQSEQQRLLEANPGRPWLLFPETREHPIRMFAQIPQRWAQRGAEEQLVADASRGEYLSFQVGMWTARAAANDVHVAFSDLRGPDGAVIPESRLTCFNLGGIDDEGKPFANRLDVAQGRVQPLWMGLDIPDDVKPGVYRGTMMISSEGVAARQVPVTINLSP